MGPLNRGLTFCVGDVLGRVEEIYVIEENVNILYNESENRKKW